MPDRTTTPGTGRASGIDSAELGLPPIAGAATLRFASSAITTPAAMPGLPERPPPKQEKTRVRDASTHQGTLRGAVNRSAKKNGLPNLSQSWKMPHRLFDRILWIWPTCRALKSFDASKKTTKPPANDPFERKNPA
jgi:hypothetical protein